MNEDMSRKTSGWAHLAFGLAVLLGDLPPYPAQVPTALGDMSGRITGNLLDAATTTNALGCSAFPAASLQDKIVLISRGTCSFDNKVNNAAKGGAAGVVIFNTNPTELLDMSLPTAKLPATFVALEAGLEMQSQLRAHPDISASIDFTGLTPIPASADVLSYFSGRGPTATGVIKPELTAVGNNVFTASTASDASYLPFTLGGGTSFAAPLVTGAAAVLMSARPGLQSADYRSLLINSSQAIRNSSGTTVDVLDGGANRLVPADARFDFVTHAEAVFEQDRQTSEVVTHAVLAADCECCTKKAGARQEERGVKFEHVEDRDDGDDPQHETGQLMQHAGGCFDALATTIFSAFDGFGADSAHGVLPPVLAATRLAVGNLAHDGAQDGVCDASEDEATDHDHDRDHWSREEALDAIYFFIGGDQCNETCRRKRVGKN